MANEGEVGVPATVFRSWENWNTRTHSTVQYVGLDDGKKLKGNQEEDDEDEDEEITYYIVGSNEVDAMEHRISDQSPIGLGIMGKKEGDTVTVEAPFGAMTFRVLNVSRQSQEG